MSLRLRGGELRKSFPREFVTPVAETAIHSCSASRNSFREYNTKRILRDSAENQNSFANYGRFPRRKCTGRTQRCRRSRNQREASRVRYHSFPPFSSTAAEGEGSGVRPASLTLHEIAREQDREFVSGGRSYHKRLCYATPNLFHLDTSHVPVRKWMAFISQSKVIAISS
ncbi:hypothetical protein PUN28_010580 [Cardiocondyla obscurior]|uniref:Uncharacterized protein n=1 Tax=Cardiocondyla obscurior TaxID=286306 RepID=A0AAW2FI26_9HYME